MSTCDLCDQPAVYHDVRVVNGVHSTTHLCQLHATQAGHNFGSIDLSSVLKVPTKAGKVGPARSCPDCGLTLADYKKTSLLGCPTCYERFAKPLKHIIASVQDNHAQHIGRAPQQLGKTLDRHLSIRRLLKQLEAAINQEEYEEAAVLRDQLRELHEVGDQHAN